MRNHQDGVEMIEGIIRDEKETETETEIVSGTEIGTGILSGQESCRGGVGAATMSSRDEIARVIDIEIGIVLWIEIVTVGLLVRLGVLMGGDILLMLFERELGRYLMWDDLEMKL
jgi:hypothetical protein